MNRRNARPHLARRACRLIGGCAALLSMVGIVQSQDAPATPSTEETARRYLGAVAERRLEAQPFAEQAIFRDPTADFFDLDNLVAGVRGRDNIIALQASWNLEKIDFDVETEFFSDPYAVFAGTATLTQPRVAPSRSMRFLTVLRIEDGAVTERHDYWDYATGFGENDQQKAAAKSTKVVADAYLAAYLEQRHDEARSMMADAIHFQDPTAVFFGPRGGDGISGAATLIERRRKTFENISEFGLDVKTSFVTNHHAVYIGRTFYRLPGASVRSERDSVRFEDPAAFVIGVRDGKVDYHRDFVDYSDFGAQARAQAKKP